MMELIETYGVFFFLGIAFLLLQISFLEKDRKEGSYDNSFHFFRKSSARIYGEWLLICFGVVGFIFGIHDNIISSFDDKNYERYNWFNARHIFQFPVDHFQMNKLDHRVLESEVDFSELETIGTKTKKPCDLIIIDKTGSNDETDNFSSRTAAERKLLLENISSTCTNPPEVKNLNDVIMLSALADFYTLNTGKIGGAFAYQGDYINNLKNLLDPSEHPKNWVLIDKASVCQTTAGAWQEMNASASSQKRTGKEIHTDFKQLFDEISRILGADDLETNKVKLTIISDFHHDDDTISLNDLKHYLKDFHDKINYKICQINLVVYPLKDKSNLLKQQEVDYLLSLFKAYFTTSVNLYETSYDDLGTQSPSKVFRHILSRTMDFQDSLPLNQVVFYQPNAGKNTINLAEAKLRIIKPETNDYVLCLRNNSAISSRFVGMNYKKDGDVSKLTKLMILNEPVCMEIVNKDKVNFVFNTDQHPKEDCEYFLEISKVGSSDKFRIPIIFRNILPVTTCIWLIITYFVSFLLILAILGRIIRETCRNSGNFLIDIIACLAGVFGAFWFFNIVWSSWGRLFLFSPKAGYSLIFILIVFIFGIYWVEKEHPSITPVGGAVENN